MECFEKRDEPRKFFVSEIIDRKKRGYLGYKQKIIQFIRRNQVYFSSSNVSTDTTVIVKDYKLSLLINRDHPPLNKNKQSLPLELFDS